MTYTTPKLDRVISNLELKCETCPFFKDYKDRGRGLCQVFDKVVRKQHLFTSDCRTAIEAEELKEILSTHNAFLKPIALNFPGRNVYKQDLGYKSSSKIGYIGKNEAGWFAHDKHGFTMAEGLPNQNGALRALLGTFKPVELKDKRSGEACQSSWAPFNTKSEVNFNTDELLEEDTPHSEFEPGQIVKVIDEGEEHTEWADFVVIGKNYNQQRFRSTESYLSETNWYYLLVSVDIPTQHQFWVAENEICHAEYSHLIDTTYVF